MPAKEDVLDNLVQLEVEADDIYEAAMKMLDSRGAARGNSCVASVNDNVTVAPPNWGSISTAAAPSATKVATAKKTPAATVASKRAPARTATVPTRGSGSRGGRPAASTRASSAAANKTGLNISITSAVAAKPAQQSILSSFASQSTRQSQRKKPMDIPANTQYISDSDSN